MKLVAQTSPYIRKNVSVKRMMLDVIIALMPVTLFAMIQNGWDGIYVFIISIVTMLLIELICHGITHWPKGMKFKELFNKEGFAKIKATYTINNILAPLISALIFALIMPAAKDGAVIYSDGNIIATVQDGIINNVKSGTKIWYPFVVFIGATFGMLVGKMLFGGLGSNIFNPAAAGRIFIGVCFGSWLTISYQSQAAYDAVAAATPLGAVKEGIGNLPEGYTLLELFLGQVPGCMGEVSALMILIGAVYLFVRKSADLRSALSYFLSFAVIMLVAAISYTGKFGGNGIEVWAYQLLSGGILFGAVFMITDPVTSPTSKFGRILFGTFAGCLTALIRIMGAYPEGVAFSILIVNMLAPTIDYFMRGKPNTYTWKECLIVSAILIVVCLIASASVMGGWF